MFKWYNGDVEEFRRKSPVQKIADYFVKNIRQQEFRFGNSFESKIENNFQKLKFDTKTVPKELFSIKKYRQFDKDELPLDALLVTRRSLVDQLALSVQLVKREQIKRKIIEKITN